MAYSLIRFRRLLPLLFDPHALKAMVKWPKFSITAYEIVSDLSKQGIHPKTLIDVGANSGQFTIAALNFFNKVCIHAFEPIESCANELRSSTNSYENVHIHTVALGAKHERVDFHVNTYTLASSMLKISAKHRSAFPQAVEIKTIAIEVLTLDHFFSNKALSAPVLLKIDVQGAEKMVLEGGEETLKKVDYILLEASFTTMYDGEALFLDLIETLKKIGFLFIRPVNFCKSPKSGEILQADILFKKAKP